MTKNYKWTALNRADSVDNGLRNFTALSPMNHLMTCVKTRDIAILKGELEPTEGAARKLKKMQLLDEQGETTSLGRAVVEALLNLKS